MTDFPPEALPEWSDEELALYESKVRSAACGVANRPASPPPLNPQQVQTA